jgi:hypothetical protein
MVADPERLWNRDDPLLPEAQIRVRGKGNKTIRPAFFPWLREQLSCSIIVCGWKGPPTCLLLYSFLSRGRLAAPG